MDRARVLAGLASGIADGSPGDTLAQRLCRACVDILGAAGGAITLSPSDAHRWTLFASDEVSGRLEDIEEVLGAGPGQEASRTGDPVVVRLCDDALEGMGEYVHQARAVAGEVTLYALPMLPVPHLLGVVTVYLADDADLALDPDECQLLADAVGATLLRDRETFEGDGAGTWAERARVHQATGIVSARLGLAPVDALALLRAHAFTDGTTLGTLATAVVEHRYDVSWDDDGPDLDGRQSEEP